MVGSHLLQKELVAEYSTTMAWGRWHLYPESETEFYS